jgi:hypothetical protein
MPRFCVVLFFSFCVTSKAQIANTAWLDTTGGVHLGKIIVGGYVDMYYGYFSGKSTDRNIPYFYSSTRNREFAVNLTYLDLRYNTDRIRARFVPAFGSYMATNYAPEPQNKNIMEASFGFRPFRNKQVWIDGGILGSPYSSESIISKDQLVYTRSVSTENVPYYLCGLRICTPISKKTTLYTYIINGWQQIADVNNSISLGTQLEIKINNNNLFTWDTYYGNEISVQHPNWRMRYFSDIYWIGKLGKKWSVTACAYLGLQKRIDSLGIGSNAFWHSANLTLQYALNSVFSISGRAEYFNDRFALQETPINHLANSFHSQSGTICANFRMYEHIVFRTEWRHFISPEPIFSHHITQGTEADWLTGSVVIWF